MLSNCKQDIAADCFCTKLVDFLQYPQQCSESHPKITSCFSLIAKLLDTSSYQFHSSPILSCLPTVSEEISFQSKQLFLTFLIHTDKVLQKDYTSLHSIVLSMLVFAKASSKLIIILLPICIFSLYGSIVCLCLFLIDQKSSLYMKDVNLSSVTIL